MSETIPLLPDKVYHIYNHANGSENLFRNDENYRYFLQRYGEFIHPLAETYAYCLMPNHFHFMIRVRGEADCLDFVKSKAPANEMHLDNLETTVNLPLLISQQFGHFFNAYTQAYNKLYNRKGSLFMPRFKRKEINDESYFTQLIAYIHLNPVRHRFCKNMLDWDYSSIHAYYLDKSSNINRKYMEAWFGNKEALIAYHTSLKLNDNLFEF